MASVAGQHFTMSCKTNAAVSSLQRPHQRQQQCRAMAAACPGGRASLCGSGITNSAQSWFAGDVRELTAAVQFTAPAVGNRRPTVVMAKPTIQFIRGIDEQTVPDVKLTRSRDGTNGVATFVFDQPSVFDSSRELGDITGLYMLDEEGVLSSVDVSAKFLNGKPAKIEARYVMRSGRDWDRFMRFMERYANENDLGFVKK